MELLGMGRKRQPAAHNSGCRLVGSSVPSAMLIALLALGSQRDFVLHVTTEGNALHVCSSWRGTLAVMNITWGGDVAGESVSCKPVTEFECRVSAFFGWCQSAVKP